MPFNLEPFFEAIKLQGAQMNLQMERQGAQMVQILEAIKAQSAPSSFNGINWTPIIQSLIGGLASTFGGNVIFSATTPMTQAGPLPIETPTTVAQIPVEVQAQINELKN
jgi:hypothetical protein